MSVATAIVEELHVVSGRRHARVGTLLMRSALRVAREAGMLCAALMVQCSNTGAMPFYHSVDFNPPLNPDPAATELIWLHVL